MPPAFRLGGPGPFRHFSPAVYLWPERGTWSHFPRRKVVLEWGGKPLPFWDVAERGMKNFRALIQAVRDRCDNRVAGRGYSGDGCLVDFDQARLR